MTNQSNAFLQRDGVQYWNLLLPQIQWQQGQKPINGKEKMNATFPCGNNFSDIFLNVKMLLFVCVILTWE